MGRNSNGGWVKRKRRRGKEQGMEGRRERRAGRERGDTFANKSIKEPHTKPPGHSPKKPSTKEAIHQQSYIPIDHTPTKLYIAATSRSEAIYNSETIYSSEAIYHDNEAIQVAGVIAGKSDCGIYTLKEIPIMAGLRGISFHHRQLPH